MRSRGVGRTEVAIGIAVVLVVGLVTMPLLRGTSNDSLRAEVPLNVDAIRIAEETNQEAFGEYISAEAAPRAPDATNATPVAWVPTKGFKTLAWEPANTTEVYGAYSVEATATGYVVRGTCDTDGDGRRATYEANEKENAKRTSPDENF